MRTFIKRLLAERSRRRSAEEAQRDANRVQNDAALSERWVVSVCVSTDGDCVRCVVAPSGHPGFGWEEYQFPLPPFTSAESRAKEVAEHSMTHGIWDGARLIPPSAIRHIVIAKAGPQSPREEK